MRPVSKKRTRSILFFLGFWAVLYFSRTLWLPWMAQCLIVSEKPEPVDVIVVLNGNNVKKRMDHALYLYQQGYAGKILISGVWELGRETDMHLGKMYLERHGVLPDAILLENESESTQENAVYTARLLEKAGYKSFILVTSPAHSFRARWVFKKFIPKEIHWISNVNPEDLDIHHWWQDVESCRDVFYEYLTMILYGLRQIPK